MKFAQNHPLENQRLEALAHLKIMDTLAEREFDEITLIASQICQAPIALISLVDNSRQWFKSKVGLSATETPKDIAFCSHAILQEDVFEVPDSSKDERFFDNPLFTGAPHVQFYAGAPVKDPVTKLPIGTLCVIDSKPRQLDEKQKEALKALSNQVSKLLELRHRILSLTDSNEKLIFQQAAFESISEGVVLQDSSGKIIDFNNAALSVLNLTADQLLGKTSMDPDWQSVREDGTPFPGDQHPAMVALSTGKQLKNIIMGIETKDNIKWLSISSSPLFLNNDSKASHSVTTFDDITKARESQQALIQTAKMTSLGEMAAGIAHEINTPLAIIVSATDQVKELFKNNAKEKAFLRLEKIQSTALRIAQIVRGLRTFSRSSEEDSSANTHLQQIILDTISLCSEKFKIRGTSLDFKMHHDPEVLCIPTQLSQVILNLLNNSLDATETLPTKWVKIDLSGDSTKCFIKITDSGHGISTAIQNKIMQPFFTTKDVGKGTGLGLSISKGIIDSFKGRLFYDTTSPNTCFIIELPIAFVEKSKSVA